MGDYHHVGSFKVLVVCKLLPGLYMSAVLEGFATPHQRELRGFSQ